jgi:hypothetical protein
MDSTEPIRLQRTYDTSAATIWELVYAMTATAPEQVEFMKNAGMPLTVESRKTFTEVSEPTRLASNNELDNLATVIAQRNARPSATSSVTSRSRALSAADLVA